MTSNKKSERKQNITTTKKKRIIVVIIWVAVADHTRLLCRIINCSTLQHLLVIIIIISAFIVAAFGWVASLCSNKPPKEKKRAQSNPRAVDPGPRSCRIIRWSLAVDRPVTPSHPCCRPASQEQWPHPRAPERRHSDDVWLAAVHMSVGKVASKCCRFRCGGFFLSIFFLFVFLNFIFRGVKVWSISRAISEIRSFFFGGA